MEYDTDKVDEMVLALLYLTSSHGSICDQGMEGPGLGSDESGLYEKGYISDPKGKALSVVLTETGEKLSKELFFKHFGVSHAQQLDADD
jgi:hypothetical protein